MRVLVVEDEPLMAQAIRDGLRLEAIASDIAGDGETALELLSINAYDIAVLDRDIPGPSGDEVAQSIVASGSGMPILMLTAADRLDDKASGFELGADDYLIKPFSPRELVARVRALLRRAHTETEPQLEVLDFGDLVIDISGHKVMVEGQEVDLTASEFKLLTTLARYPGRVYTRMELVEKVLGYDFEGYERTIDSHVKNLRAKLGDDPRNPRWLYTVHGVGYRFEAPEKTEDSSDKS